MILHCKFETCWQIKEVKFLMNCELCGPQVHPSAPKEPLDADAQAEADGGDDEAPQDVESDDGSVAGSSPGRGPPAGPLPTPLRPAWECRGARVTGNRFTGHRFPSFRISEI